MAPILHTSPLPEVATLAEAKARTGALVDADALAGPAFYTVAGALTVAVLLDGTVREAEVIAPRGIPELVIL